MGDFTVAVSHFSVPELIRVEWVLEYLNLDQSGGSRFKLQAGLKEEICVSLLQLASQHRWVVETVGVWLFLSTVVINLNTHTHTHTDHQETECRNAIEVTNKNQSIKKSFGVFLTWPPSLIKRCRVQSNG